MIDSEVLLALILSVVAALILFLSYRPPLFRPVNLIGFYWIGMILFGTLLLPLTADFYVMDRDLFPTALLIYGVTFLFFYLGVYQYRAVFGAEISYIEPLRDAGPSAPIELSVSPVIPIGAIVLSVIIFAATFDAVGYIPLFGELQASKYFTDKLDVYIQYRPFYVSAMLLLSTVLCFLLGSLPAVRQKGTVLLLIAACTVLLLATGKRGQLLLPFLYFALAWTWHRRNFLPIVVGTAGIFVAAAFMHSVGPDVNSLGDVAERILTTAGFSVFVGPRELTRLLTFYQGEQLFGLSYLAGLLSFIPTEVLELKAKYNYMRYIMELQGSNPDLSGGMRAGFAGEALINFGYIGVVVVSYLFGAATAAIEKRVLSPRFLDNGGFLAKYVIIFLLWRAVTAFFENGSAFFLFFAVQATILYFLLRYCLNIPLFASHDARHSETGEALEPHSN